MTKRYFVINYQVWNDKNETFINWIEYASGKYPSFVEIEKWLEENYTDMHRCAVNSIWELNEQDFKDYTRDCI